MAGPTHSTPFVVSGESDGREASELNELLAVMTDDEKRAAARFNETTEDGEGYDVPKPMMKRLCELGLVKYIGFGRYEQTNAILELEDTLKTYSSFGG